MIWSNHDGFPPFLETARYLLTESFGEEVTFSKVERLTEEDRRSLVLRIHLEKVPVGSPLTIILKKVKLDAFPEEEHDQALQRFAADWAGNNYLAGLPAGPCHSPAFHGGDLLQQFILLEDMGDVPTLVDPLLYGNALQAESALLAFATLLGQMHANTIGDFSTFEQIARPLSAPLNPFFHHPSEALIERIQKICVEWNIPLPDTAQRDMRQVIHSIHSPGPFYAYIHADPCPDNMYHKNGSYRLIDFETGGFSHALSDAAYFRMSFPTCWCANRVPDEIVEKAETVYRAELARTCPEAADDRVFYPALVEMCGYRAMVEIGYWAKRADDNPAGKWGITTLPPRVVTRLETFIRTSEQFGQLKGLRDLCEGALIALEKRWGAVERLTVYPAFRV